MVVATIQWWRLAQWMTWPIFSFLSGTGISFCCSSVDFNPPSSGNCAFCKFCAILMWISDSSYPMIVYSVSVSRIVAFLHGVHCLLHYHNFGKRSILNDHYTFSVLGGPSSLPTTISRISSVPIASGGSSSLPTALGRTSLLLIALGGPSLPAASTIWILTCQEH